MDGDGKTDDPQEPSSEPDDEGIQGISHDDHQQAVVKLEHEPNPLESDDESSAVAAAAAALEDVSDLVSAGEEAAAAAMAAAAAAVAEEAVGAVLEDHPGAPHHYDHHEQQHEQHHEQHHEHHEDAHHEDTHHEPEGISAVEIANATATAMAGVHSPPPAEGSEHEEASVVDATSEHEAALAAAAAAVAADGGMAVFMDQALLATAAAAAASSTAANAAYAQQVHDAGEEEEDLSGLTMEELSQRHDALLAARRLKDRRRYATMSPDQRATYNAHRRELYHKQGELARKRRRDRERARYHSVEGDDKMSRNARRAKLERDRYNRLSKNDLEDRNRKRRDRARLRKVEGGPDDNSVAASSDNDGEHSITMSVKEEELAVKQEEEELDPRAYSNVMMTEPDHVFGEEGEEAIKEQDDEVTHESIAAAAEAIVNAMVPGIAAAAAVADFEGEHLECETLADDVSNPGMEMIEDTAAEV